jgi:hypothetical protein
MISGSPFPSREAGAKVRSWGVRFFDLLRMVQDLSMNKHGIARMQFYLWQDDSRPQ